MSGRCGKTDPSESKNGIEKMIESVIAPFGPPTVVTSALTMVFLLILSRRFVSGFFVMSDMASAHIQRKTTMSTVMSSTYPISAKLLI